MKETKVDYTKINWEPVQVEYYMIVNMGTLGMCDYVQFYPRQLVLAQIYVQEKYYRKTLRNIRRRSSIPGYPQRIILDNGAHENAQVSTEDYFQVVCDLEPDVVVLPDKIGEAHYDSRNFSMLFGSMIKNKFPRMEMMYVPQGRNKEEILAEFQWAYLSGQLPENVIVGWGQSYLTWEDEHLKDEDARFRLMSDVSKLMKGREIKHRSHILGGRWRPRNFGPFYNYFNFRGLDSIKPCTCALQGKTYPEYKHRKTEIESMACADVDLLYENIGVFCEQYGIRSMVPDAIDAYIVGAE